MNQPLLMRVGRRDVALTPEMIRAFWERVSGKGAPTADGCWLWTGSHSDARPIFLLKGGGVIGAQRMAVVIARNADLDKQRLSPCQRHASCVNPEHARPWGEAVSLELPKTLTRLAVAQGQDIPRDEVGRARPRARHMLAALEEHGDEMRKQTLQLALLKLHVKHFVRYPSGSVLLDGDFGRIHESSWDEAFAALARRV